MANSTRAHQSRRRLLSYIASVCFVVATLGCSLYYYEDEGPSIATPGPDILYVDSVQGSDSRGDGSSTSPWASLYRAVSQAGTGDVIRLLPGNYFKVPFRITQNIIIEGLTFDPKTVYVWTDYADTFIWFNNPNATPENCGLRNLTLSGGNSANGWGASLQISSGRPALSNLIIRNARQGADYGDHSVICVKSGASPVIDDVVISGVIPQPNASYLHGLRAEAGTDITVNRLTINDAKTSAVKTDGTITLTDCDLTDTTSGYGATVWLSPGASATLSDCRLQTAGTYNIFAEQNSTLTVSGCVLRDAAQESVFLASGAFATIVNSRFYDPYMNGVRLSDGAGATIFGSLFVGGFRGVYLGNSNTEITNSTFHNQSAQAIVEAHASSGLDMTNCAFGTTGFSPAINVNAPALLKHCAFLTGAQPLSSPITCIETTLALMFVNPSADNYLPPTGSPLINVGALPSPGYPSVDLNGNPRLAGTAMDIGALETNY